MLADQFAAAAATGEIRNPCAHSRKPISLENSVLRVPCEVVIADMLRDIVDDKPSTLRLAFTAKCMFIVLYI
jgi:hypothetical protein